MARISQEAQEFLDKNDILKDDFNSVVRFLDSFGIELDSFEISPEVCFKINPIEDVEGLVFDGDFETGTGIEYELLHTYKNGVAEGMSVYVALMAALVNAECYIEDYIPTLE